MLLLRETFRIAALLCSFGPRIAVGVKGNALDVHPAANPGEFGGAVARVHRAQFWEKRPGSRQGSKHFLHLAAEVDHGHGPGLAPGKADNAGIPIHVFCSQKRDIGLRSSEHPAELVEGAPGGIGLVAEDGLVLIGRDRPLLAKLDLWPVFFGNEGPRQPAHVQGKVVDSAEENIGRDRAGLHHPEQVFSPGFEEGQVSDGIECGVLEHADPALMGAPGFGLGEFLQGHFPRALRGLRIGSRQIGAGDLEVELGLTDGLVTAGQKCLGFGAISGAQTLLFSGVAIVDVEHAGFGPAIETETTFHGSISFEFEPASPRDSAGVAGTPNARPGASAARNAGVLQGLLGGVPE